jgi:hypothetical protein
MTAMLRKDRASAGASYALAPGPVPVPFSVEFTELGSLGLKFGEPYGQVIPALDVTS